MNESKQDYLNYSKIQGESGTMMVTGLSELLQPVIVGFVDQQRRKIDLHGE